MGQNNGHQLEFLSVQTQRPTEPVLTRFTETRIGVFSGRHLTVEALERDYQGSLTASRVCCGTGSDLGKRERALENFLVESSTEFRRRGEAIGHLPRFVSAVLGSCHEKSEVPQENTPMPESEIQTLSANVRGKRNNVFDMIINARARHLRSAAMRWAAFFGWRCRTFRGSPEWEKGECDSTTRAWVWFETLFFSPCMLLTCLQHFNNRIKCRAAVPRRSHRVAEVVTTHSGSYSSMKWLRRLY